MDYLNTTEEQERYQRAVKRVKKVKGFYSHLIVYLLINTIIIIANCFYGRNPRSFTNIETYFTALFWGIGLVSHGLSVFGPSLFLGEKWEERKIKELMEKENKH